MDMNYGDADLHLIARSNNLWHCTTLADSNIRTRWRRSKRQGDRRRAQARTASIYESVLSSWDDNTSWEDTVNECPCHCPTISVGGKELGGWTNVGVFVLWGFEMITYNSLYPCRRGAVRRHCGSSDPSHKLFTYTPKWSVSFFNWHDVLEHAPRVQCLRG